MILVQGTVSSFMSEYEEGIIRLFRNVGIGLGILFRKIGIRNGYASEAWMALPQPKSGQVNSWDPAVRSLIHRPNEAG